MIRKHNICLYSAKFMQSNVLVFHSSPGIWSSLVDIFFSTASKILFLRILKKKLSLKNIFKILNLFFFFRSAWVLLGTNLNHGYLSKSSHFL